MSNDTLVFFRVCVSVIIGYLFGAFWTEKDYEKGLLRFCMTHSISLEQCKILEEGE